MTGAVYIEQKNWIVFFLQNYNFVAMSLDNFNKMEYFRIDNLEKIQVGYLQNYITSAVHLEMGETAKYLLITERGDTLVSDFLGESVRIFFG